MANVGRNGAGHPTGTVSFVSAPNESPGHEGPSAGASGLDGPGHEGPGHENEELLTPSEVAALFRVNPKTVTRWARSGKISAIRTLGGHRRFRASEVHRFLEQVETGAPEP
jgi:excisionase family DNA binding protein